jgi:hypothetical protein
MVYFIDLFSPETHEGFRSFRCMMYIDLERRVRSKDAAIREDLRTGIESGLLFSFEQLEQVSLLR